MRNYFIYNGVFINDGSDVYAHKYPDGYVTLWIGCKHLNEIFHNSMLFYMKLAGITASTDLMASCGLHFSIDLVEPYEYRIYNKRPV